VVEAYGLAEATAITHSNPVYGERREGSIGVPLPLSGARILALDSEREMPPGEQGRLTVSGPQVMKRYWGMEGETEAVLHEGWLLTGDVAHRDEDGYFYVAGRQADTIPVGKEIVYPREVEAILVQSNKVDQALVVGETETRSGETAIIAYVVPSDDAETTERELVLFCASRLPPHAVPTRIEFREDLPRTALGKYVRRAVADD
jgi:long-chain acyl-CoA synthetase